MHTGSRSRKPGRRKVAHMAEGRVSPLSAGRKEAPQPRSLARLKGLWSMGNPALLSGLESWDSARLWVALLDAF